MANTNTTVQLVRSRLLAGKTQTTRKALFILFIAFSVSMARGQSPAIEWQKSLGGTKSDEAYSIQQTTEGGFVMAGRSYSDNSDVSGHHGSTVYDDYWIVKLDFFGNLEWQKSFGGSNYDRAYFIQQTTDGGFVVAGSSWSNDGDVSGHHGSTSYNDCWIVKLDFSGDIEWQKSLGGSEYDDAYSIRQTTDGGFVVAGSSTSKDGDVSGNHGSSDYWIVKLDFSGDIEWQKSLGGTNSDYAQSIQQSTDGGFVVAGYSESNDGDVSGNHGSSDYWIVKLDFLGNLEWQKCLGGSSSDRAYSIQQATDGGFVVAGYSSSNDGDVSGNLGYFDYWIVKLDFSGNTEWQKGLGGSNLDFAFSIRQTTDGGFVVAGESHSSDGDVTGHHGSNSYADYWIVKLDTAGNVEWQKSLGGSHYDKAQSIQQTTDGGFVVAGYSGSNDGDVSGHHGAHANSDCWITKLSASACPQPVSLSTSDITSSSAKLSWSEVSGAEGYKIRYKIAGTNTWTNKKASSNSKKLSGLLPGTEYVWEIKTYCTIAPNTMSGWSGKQSFTTLSEKQAEDILFPFELSLFPNPTDGKLSIQVTAVESQSLTLKLFDFLGREVFSSDEGEVSGVFNKKLDFSSLPSGTYFLKMMHDGESEMTKVVIER